MSAENDLEEPDLRQRNEAERAVAAVQVGIGVLPQALQRSKRPAEALARQRLDPVRRLGPGNGVCIEERLVARFLHGDREILVLGERVGREPAELDQSRSAPRSDGARNDRDAAQRGQRPALQVLRGYVFERLPARQHIDAVADFCIAGDGADFGIDEPARELCDRLLLELRVGIESHHDLARRHLEPGVDGFRFAAVGDGEEDHAPVGAKSLAHDVRGAVGRAVVDNDDLRLGIGAVEDALHRIADDPRLIVRGNEHRDRRASAR